MSELITQLAKAAAAHSARHLTPAEEKALAVGESQWFPTLFPNSDTPIPDMMSSPGKGALMAGLLGGAGGAGLGAILGKGDPTSVAGGALVGGGLSSLLAALSRHSDNNELRALSRRLPRGATLYDMENNPVVSRRLHRDAITTSGALAGGY